MSLQTGVETPHGPASRQLRDRVKYRMRLWQSEPNPLWMREMRQAARLVRTPVILMVLAVLVTMLMASLGGVMAGSLSPAQTGTALFHVFFSLAFFVVSLVGPALAANSIASEREGHTWEAVLLTGMRPGAIARGKFWAAYTAMAMYIVMLAPVGTLPFLFGGVTPLEVVVAFAFLFLFALLGVAFGLAISAKMQSLRVALLVTLLLAIFISIMAYLAFGVGLSVAAHQLWDGVIEGAPVWLPTAYSRAPFDLEYVALLIVLPVIAVALPAWFLYEVTHANLTSITDDRSYGLKKWFVVTSLALTAAAAVPMAAGRLADRDEFLVAGISVLVLYWLFCAFVFQGEPLGPSRRVKAMLAGARRLRRWLSPGVVPAAWLQLGFVLFGFAALTAVGLGYMALVPSPSSAEQMERTILFSAYATGFSLFTVGLAALLRARAKSSAVPRVLLLVLLLFLATGPWIAAAITGVLALAGSGSSDAALAVACPSPFYAFVAIGAVGRPDPTIPVIASMSCSILYGALGMVFLVMASTRCRKIIREHESLLAEADRRLAEEDQQLAEARSKAEAAMERDAAAFAAVEMGAEMGAEGDAARDGDAAAEGSGESEDGHPQ